MAQPFGDTITELEGDEFIQLWKPSTLLNGMMDTYRGNLVDMLAAGESTFAGLTITGALDIDETTKDSVFNPLKGSTADVVIHGDTVDNIFMADVSGDALLVDGIITFNNIKGADADVIIHGDTVNNIFQANVSADTVQFGGITVINPLGGAAADFEINGDAIADMLLADVSADTLFIEGITVINYSKGAAADFTIHGDAIDNILMADVSGDLVSFGGAVEVVGNFTFNDAGAATSIFRVESDADANLIITDPANNRVGIGVAVPLAKLHASGSTILGCAAAAAADADLGVSQINLAVDETGHNLLIKVKYSDTTVKTATVALT